MRRLRIALLALLLVMVAGTVGYVILDFSLLDALYQTVTTVATVGFREVQPLDATGMVFTMVLILVGVGIALYTFGVALEALIEGHLRTHVERRRMDRHIDRMSGHVIICGSGRVGRASAAYLRATGRKVVVIDRDPDRLQGIECPYVLGDVSDDQTLQTAGIERARALIAALDTDADNVYVTLTSRALRDDLVIIARARDESSKSKLIRAGANRAVNPQMIGGRRMAAFALQPDVAEFLDVVMQHENLEFRIEQVNIEPDSPLAGRSLREAALRESTGVLLLAVRTGDGPYIADPPPDTRLESKTVLIAVGTHDQINALRQSAGAKE
ncbi:MAG TPA: potassium channel protein [Jiangellaceae bacterium]